jgi:hypothetical protein
MKTISPASSRGTRRAVKPYAAAIVAELGKMGLPPTAYRRLLRGLGLLPREAAELLDRQVARRKRQRRPVDAAKPDRGSRVAPAIEASAFAPSARAKAVLRGIAIAEEDLRRSGGAYDLEQVRRLLHGVSRQSIDKRVRDRGLLAVTGPSNKRHFPAVQFKDDGSVVEGLRDVLEALPTKNGYAVLNFLVHPDRRLDGQKPIDLLAAGKVARVVEAARRMGEQGA